MYGLLAVHESSAKLRLMYRLMSGHKFFDLWGNAMRLIELFILVVALSMDAFALAVCAGLTMAKTTMKKC